jgi:LPXTG-site transpeptidase (sortase) family protein
MQLYPDMHELTNLKNNRREVALISTGLILIVLSCVVRCDLNDPTWSIKPIRTTPVVIQSNSKSLAEITIPSVSIAAPVKSAKIIDNAWEVSKDSASHLSGSSYPSEGGNIIIYAHNTPELFGNLKKVRVGDVVYVKDKSGHLKLYTVINEFETTPKNMSVIQPTKYEVLTLYTCSGFADSKRLIVQAIPLIR